MVSSSASIRSTMLSPREAMIETQLRPGGVRDERLLAAMGAIEREAFVTAPMKGVAYVDRDIELASGRWLMEPLTFARMVEALEISAADKVLIIGGGSGYAAAVMVRLAGSVIALEQDHSLLAMARKTLTKEVTLAAGALAQGYAEAAPYDAILFGGAVERIPPVIESQLKEGGRIAAVVRIAPQPGSAGSGLGKVKVGRKLQGHVALRPLADACVRLLPGFEASEGFVF